MSELSTLNSELSTVFSDRLLPLSDGRSGLRTTLHTEVRDPSLAPSDGERVGERGEIRDNSCNSCLDFISSDESLDRYDEIITASGWRLANYQRNPVFQNAHQYGDVIFTLGKALATEVRSGRLFQRIEFACDINPMARIAYGLYKAKFLSAVSVGFIPIRWENGTEQTAYRRRFVEQELLEVSAVAIPANPNALALGLKSGAIERSDLQELSQLIRHALSTQHPDKHHSNISTQDILKLRDVLKQL
jgi:HK97 family phage prohead protease